MVTSEWELGARFVKALETGLGGICANHLWLKLVHSRRCSTARKRSLGRCAVTAKRRRFLTTYSPHIWLIFCLKEMCGQLASDSVLSRNVMYVYIKAVG